MTIAWPCIKVKQLGRVYQVYSKQLPYKGSCIRFEEQKSFSSNTPAPTLSSLLNTFTPPLPEHILNVVFPQYLQLSQADSSMYEYPLYHIREMNNNL